MQTFWLYLNKQENKSWFEAGISYEAFLDLFFLLESSF